MGSSKVGGSRGEILALLCTGRRTADELAAALGISAPAVRKSLARLEEEGLVEFEPVRRSARKPAHEYRITARGERSLSRAYLPFLQDLLAELEARVPETEMESLLREVGRRLAGAGEPDRAPTAETAVARLRGLGALASLREEGGGRAIECSCCAIGALVIEHPLACKAMESMLSEYLGRPVLERCDRSDRPSCRFELDVGVG